jgi:hypothetical protein
MDAFGAIGPAWERMSKLLFRGGGPLVWFALGFVFFLQSCVEDGGGGGIGSFNNLGKPSRSTPFGRSSAPVADHGFDEMFGDSTTWLSEHLLLIIALTLIIVIPMIILGNWLGARGRAMAIAAVAQEGLTIGQLWNSTAATGQRIFYFQLIMTLIGLVTSIPLAAYGIFAIALPLVHKETTIEAIFSNLTPIVAVSIATMALLIPFGVTGSLFRNFVFPLSVRDKVSLGESWRAFWRVGRNHIGGLFVFFLARFLIGFTFLFLNVIVIVCTCCIGALPYLRQVILSPFYVFERAHALYALESLGPEFKVIDAALPGGPDQGGFNGPFGGPGMGYPGVPGYQPTTNPYAPPAAGNGGQSGFGGGQGGFGQNPYG